MKKSSQNMLQGPLLKNIILYTIPVILTGALQLLFNAADLVVVGRFRGSLAVGAVGATGSITRLLINFFIGLSVGAGVSATHVSTLFRRSSSPTPFPGPLPLSWS